MIDSITIFTKTGIILYHNSNPSGEQRRSASSSSLSKASRSAISPESIRSLNSFLSQYLFESQSVALPNATFQKSSRRLFLNSRSSSTNNLSDKAAGGGGGNDGVGKGSLATTVAEWEDFNGPEDCDWMAVAIYPKVLLDHDVANLGWIRRLLQRLMKEYNLFYTRMLHDRRLSSAAQAAEGEEKKEEEDALLAAGGWVPNSDKFNATFHVLFQQARSSAADYDPHDTNNAHDHATSPPAATRERQRRGAYDTKKGKEARVWHDSTHKITSKSMAALDRSKASDSANGLDAMGESAALIEARATYLPSPDETPLWEEEEPALDDDDGDGANASNTWGNSIGGILTRLSGNKILTSSDLTGPLSDLNTLLTSKNVASDIADNICRDVEVRLVGKKLASLTRVKTAVRQALEVTIGRLLKPGGKGRSGAGGEFDLLRAVVEKRERGNGFFSRGGDAGKGKKPYVIVMVGINGVGKSTSLAKLAYYLTSHSCKPLIAACDTFRSGAVEQLNVHASCLNVPLYQKGYAKDPASVAADAIRHASGEGHDVVLVDTAGRMQNNVPLMKALSDLVVKNDPDLVLFVCEALVGNDGVDQLRMFDRALRTGGHARKIDGIVLTKFDTVSDKVGAALTMTHVTGAPVVFVGTGQKYNHLMKLSTQAVIKSLFA